MLRSKRRVTRHFEPRHFRQYPRVSAIYRQKTPTHSFRSSPIASLLKRVELEFQSLLAKLRTCVTSKEVLAGPNLFQCVRRFVGPTERIQFVARRCLRRCGNRQVRAKNQNQQVIAQHCSVHGISVLRFGPESPGQALWRRCAPADNVASPSPDPPSRPVQDTALPPYLVPARSWLLLRAQDSPRNGSCHRPSTHIRGLFLHLPGRV